MTAIDTRLIGDRLHRLAKLALDTGEVTRIEEALALFQTYAVHVILSPDVAACPASQAALLTAVNAGRRAFLGGVTVSGAEETPLLVAVPGADSLAGAVELLGGAMGEGPAGAPQILIGAAENLVKPESSATICVALDGWAFHCGPAHLVEAKGGGAHVLAGIAGAAVALSEAFQLVRGSNPAAGRRVIGFSLFGGTPGEADHDWRSATSLPSEAWLIGLGNLGQAYLWALSLLPYADPAEVRLVLQDFDKVAESNDSTSLWTRPALFGRYKTRAMAELMEARGFRTTIVERPFNDLLRVAADDPQVALCGVDNGLARSALEDAGFARVFESGLGNGPSDFLALRFHSFPGPRAARDLWRAQPKSVEALLDQPAYRELAGEGADRCGLVELAGRVVGAPFVGALAGAIVVAELVKMANGLPNAALLDLHLRTPDGLEFVEQPGTFAFNPGSPPRQQSSVTARRPGTFGSERRAPNPPGRNWPNNSFRECLNERRPSGNAH